VAELEDCGLRVGDDSLANAWKALNDAVWDELKAFSLDEQQAKWDEHGGPLPEVAGTGVVAPHIKTTDGNPLVWAPCEDEGDCAEGQQFLEALYRFTHTPIRSSDTGPQPKATVDKPKRNALRAKAEWQRKEVGIDVALFESVDNFRLNFPKDIPGQMWEPPMGNLMMLYKLKDKPEKQRLLLARLAQKQLLQPALDVVRIWGSGTEAAYPELKRAFASVMTSLIFTRGAVDQRLGLGEYVWTGAPTPKAPQASRLDGNKMYGKTWQDAFAENVRGPEEVEADLASVQALDAQVFEGHLVDYESPLLLDPLLPRLTGDAGATCLAKRLAGADGRGTKRYYYVQNHGEMFERLAAAAGCAFAWEDGLVTHPPCTAEHQALIALAWAEMVENIPGPWDNGATLAAIGAVVGIPKGVDVDDLVIEHKPTDENQIPGIGPSHMTGALGVDHFNELLYSPTALKAVWDGMRGGACAPGVATTLTNWDTVVHWGMVRTAYRRGCSTQTRARTHMHTHNPHPLPRCACSNFVWPAGECMEHTVFVKFMLDCTTAQDISVPPGNSNPVVPRRRMYVGGIGMGEWVVLSSIWGALPPACTRRSPPTTTIARSSRTPCSASLPLRRLAWHSARI
jgi:hypothetical protein